MNKNELLNIYLRTDGIPRSLLQLAGALGFRVIISEYYNKDKVTGKTLAYTILTKDKAVINIYQNEDKSMEMFMLAYQLAEFITLPREYGVRSNDVSSLKPEICKLANRMINRQKLYRFDNKGENKNNKGK